LTSPKDSLTGQSLALYRKIVSTFPQNFYAEFNNILIPVERSHNIPMAGLVLTSGDNIVEYKNLGELFICIHIRTYNNSKIVEPWSRSIPPVVLRKFENFIKTEFRKLT